MYDKVMFKGKTLKMWSEILRHEFTPGELYQMMLKGVDFTRMMHSFEDQGL